LKRGNRLDSAFMAQKAAVHIAGERTAADYTFILLSYDNKLNPS